MAIRRYTILFQKSKEGSPVMDLYRDFNMLCTSFPFRIASDTKPVVADDYPDEDGEDAFFPDKLKLKAYDVDAGICYVGDPGSASRNVSLLIDYLAGEDGNGTELKVYNPYTNIGRNGMYLRSFDEDVFNSSSEDIAVFTVKFGVTSPRPNIVPVTDAAGNVINLTEV